MSTSTSLPYYPAYSMERGNELVVWWFEKNFCQIGYGPLPERGRNSCVLIVLLTAAKIAQRSVQMTSDVDGNPCRGLVTALGEAILEGIETYSKLNDEKKLVALNLNVPEAVQALGRKVTLIHEWKSYLYAVSMADNLANFLQEGIHAWNFKSLAKKHYLFIVLIADYRAVLLVVDQITKTVTFIDSHPHSSTHGACIVQANILHIKQLCRWICRLFKDLYNSDPNCFEISYFQLRQR